MRLNINGTGYLLVPGEQVDAGVYDYIRYYTRPESALRVERHNSDLGETRPTNISDEYWLVIDGSGAKYRFGATFNSEMVMGVYGDDPGAVLTVISKTGTVFTMAATHGILSSATMSATRGARR